MSKKREMPSQEELDKFKREAGTGTLHNEPGFGSEQKTNGHDKSAEFAAKFGIGSGGPAETDTTAYTRAQLIEAVKFGVQLGRLTAGAPVKKFYAERLRRLEKRLRRVKHALHAISAEALQD
jgi:hypothetical protein